MDVSKENKEIVLKAIHDWLSSLPRGVVDVKEEHGEYESVVKIKPFKSKASPLEFRIGNYGTFDVAMGMGMQFSDRGSNSWRGILGIGKKQFIEYEPYI